MYQAGRGRLVLVDRVVPNRLEKGHHLHKRYFIAVAATVLLALPAALPAANMGEANKAPVASPDTPVASDGPAPAAVATGLAESAPAEGSGELSPENVFGVALPGMDGFGIDSIIPPDTRVQVTNTTTFPARAAVHIQFSGGGCSGWMIGANTVATAGHCLNRGAGGGWFDRTTYVITPGANGTLAPFGRCGARQLFSVLGWTRDGNEQFDYGAIKLNCNVGNQTGWFGFFATSSSLNGKQSRINGYPGDKPSRTQWSSLDSIRVSQTNQLFYRNDTFNGDSGSAVWTTQGPGACAGLQCAMAIHGYGLHGSPPHSTNNHGKRITTATFNNLISWRNAP
jgi:glutamyl endopeptidase